MKEIVLFKGYESITKELIENQNLSFINLYEDSEVKHIKIIMDDSILNNNNEVFIEVTILTNERYSKNETMLLKTEGFEKAVEIVNSIFGKKVDVLTKEEFGHNEIAL